MNSIKGTSKFSVSISCSLATKCTCIFDIPTNIVNIIRYLSKTKKEYNYIGKVYFEFLIRNTTSVAYIQYNYNCSLLPVASMHCTIANLQFVKSQSDMINLITSNHGWWLDTFCQALCPQN